MTVKILENNMVLGVAVATLIYYIVACATALGALYLTTIKVIADRRDKLLAAQESARREQIERDAQIVEQALRAAQQAGFIERLQRQSTALSNELEVVKKRQRRGIAIQLGSAMVFFVLLIGLFIYENTVNQRLTAAATQGEQATETANTANRKSTEAVDEVKATTQREHLGFSSSHKKRSPLH